MILLARATLGVSIFRRRLPTAQLWKSALRINEDTRYRFCDSLIVAAAIESGASLLYTEDLQHERHIGHPNHQSLPLKSASALRPAAGWPFLPPACLHSQPLTSWRSIWMA